MLSLTGTRFGFQVFELAELLPCVDDVIPSILAVDEQILVLPSFVHEIRNMTVDVKKMIETARNQVRSHAAARCPLWCRRVPCLIPACAWRCRRVRWASNWNSWRWSASASTSTASTT